MNVKLKVVSVGALFFLGFQGINAQQSKKDTLEKEKQIDEVVVVGYKLTTKSTAVTSTAKIGSESLNNRPGTNVLNIAQGQLAGVNIVTGTGQPGATPSITVRGKGSLLGNNEPLYVIDGFPGGSESFRNINPNDIESMEVLKDASALSQFGNRGANGVVVVRTKRAKYNQGVSFGYSTQFGVSTLQKHRYNLADAKELLTIEKRLGRGKGASMTDAQIADYAIDTDWLGYFFQPSTLQSHDFSVSAGSENLNNYTSIGYLDQQGILSTTGMKRFTLRNNLNGKSKDRKFNYSVGTALSLTRNTQASSLNTGGVNQNLALGAMKGVPHLSPDEYQDGEQLFNKYLGNQTLIYTPLFLMDKERNFKSSTDEARVDIMTEASYKILPTLTARVRANMTFRNLNDNVWQHPNAFNSFLFAGSGQEFRGWETFANSRVFSFNNLAQLEYSKDFGDHKLDLSGAFEFNNNMLQSSSQTQNGLNLRTWIPGTGTGYIASTEDFYLPNVSASQSRQNLFSYFANAEYGYKGKYGVVANIRRDATSRFSRDNTWGTFWSVGARWNVSKESFMENVSWVNDLKIRGSIGTQGNERIPPGGLFDGLRPQRYLNTFAVSSLPVYGSALGYGVNLGYPNLSWEVTQNINVGTDFELFSRRLRGQFDAYQKTTMEMIYPYPQSALLGQTSLSRNTDIDVKNAGLELNLAYDIIRSASRDVTLTLRGNGAINRERVYNIPENPLISGSTVQTYSANGHLWQAPYVYKYLGVNPNNGNLLFESANGTPTEAPTDADLKPLKYNFRNPKYVGGFGFDFDYKGFFLNTTFNYVAGIYRYDYDLQGYYSPDDVGQFNVSRDLLNAWTPSNTNTNIPSNTAANRSFQTRSDRFLVESSYLRLRNLQLGYRIPNNVLEGTFVKSLMIMVQGENLYTWSKWRGFDAESNRPADQYGYPTPRIFTLGIDVKF
ncbi:SusC/RagA family TonB-linked outer membrane protein [Chryseobacterium sp.]|uniref:SusC/RagA family TonB-linked outer membrane protein n=1 Tax=Chryseobacterium sp. TaxID=1871047 RepID=UPI0028969A82|nr:SusC/RagA family TonB-linked outer membrane protein [Chryseobacterium sp.]